MALENQVKIDQSDSTYICMSCNNRKFKRERELLEHCRLNKKHRSRWCERCRILFVDAEALQKHVGSSTDHAVCDLKACGRDKPGELELADHQAKAHSYCRRCQVNFEDYKRHRIESHGIDGYCESELDRLPFNTNDDAALTTNGSNPHNNGSRECYGCTRTFDAESDVILHLESGDCPRGITDYCVDTWAMECYQRGCFILRDDGSGRRQPYYCSNCKKQFPRLSLLFQHVEGPCFASHEGGALLDLRRYLFKKVRRFTPEPFLEAEMELDA